MLGETSRGHLYNKFGNVHLDFMKRAKFDVVQMFTPPKSKSPWEAATSGSTGGWASFAGPSTTTNPNDPAGWGWVGPALTAASGAIPVVGPLISAGLGASGAMGGGTGFQGTDKGWSNLGSTALGALGGYGLGGIGAGVGGAISGASSGGLGALGSGFTSGVQGYLGTPIIPGISQTSGTAIGQGISGLFGGGATTGAGTTAAGSPYALTSQPTGTALAGLGGQQTAFLPGAAASTTSALADPMKMLGGLGMAALSQAVTAPPQPSLGEMTAKWLDTDTITKAGELAMDKGNMYLGDFNVDAETQALMEAGESKIRKAYSIRREDLDKMGIYSNEQWMRSGERLEMHRRLAEEEQREVDLFNADLINRSKQQFASNQYSYITETMKLSEEAKRDLLYGNLMDVMMQYKMTEDQVMDFRTIARDAGLYMFATQLMGI